MINTLQNLKNKICSLNAYKQISLLMLTLISVATHAQVSVTATAGTTGPTAYTTVNAALAAITAGTHQGAVLITITGNTTEPIFSAANQLVASGTGLANYQSVRIVPQGNVVVNSAATPSANRGMLEFIGADSITIDGDDPLTPGTRNLTFQMAISTNTYTSALRFSSSAATANTGCRDVTVKNCIIIGARNSATSTTINFGITASVGGSGTMTAITEQAADNDNMRIENNEFKRSYYGFHAYGHATNVMDSLVIRNNKFGNDTSAINMGLFGIYLGYTGLTSTNRSAIIEGNDIQGGDYGTAGWGANIAGINLVAGNAGAIIRNNNIHDISQPNTGGYGAYGIFLSNATSNAGIQIHNNFIRGVRTYTYQNSNTSTFQPVGIFVSTGVTGIRINHNTIVMPPQLFSSTTFSSHGVLLNSAATLSEFNNNIIVNQYPSSAGFAVTFTAAGNYSSASFDRNNYFVAGPNIGFAGGAVRSSLAALRVITLKDSNSFVSNPPFISSTNLRLQAGVKSILESNGAVTSITTDIDGNVRPGPAGSVNGGALAPDIGAHEADMIVDNKQVDSVTVTQITGFVSPGNTNQGILRIAAHVSGTIGNLRMSSLYFNTAGSTAAADIANAKVYFTGSSSLFNISTAYGSLVTTPSGAFVISDTTLLNTGINYFWLAYDISGTATNTNVVDARLDSIQYTYNVTPGFLLPVNGNPAGNVVIAAPMTYVSSTATHPTLDKIETGTNNNQMLRVRVIMSSAGAPVSVSQLSLDVAGSANPLTNIDSISVWYTGANPNFVSPTFYGSASTQSGPYTVTGALNLLNDTNYFWVTYRVPATATIGDSVDAVISSITIAGTPQTPLVTSPNGSRLIKGAYCTTTYSNGCGADFIARVRLGNLDNSTGCNGQYTFFNNVPIPSLTAGMNYTITLNYGSDGNQYARVWVDWNDDGDFTDAGEDLGIQTPANAGANGQATVTFAVPCDATTGNLRMRIRGGDDTQPLASQSCGISSSNWGEGEDYLIQVVNAPASHTASDAIQRTGTTSVGSTNVQILRVPVKVVSTACAPGVITELRFNTAGSTNVADIASAKLYRTGNSSVFSIANLVGTVTSPNGQFVFTTADTALNDTNNYWLVYDVSGTATNSNVIDARFDSVEFAGSWYTPITSAPAGNVLISTPMTYLGSDAIHPTLSKIERGTTNNQILRVMVRTSSTGAPIQVTQLSLSTNGSVNPLTNSDSIIVWYTGSNPNFSTANFFGGVGAQSGTFAVTGTQNLGNDTNYFWVTYNVPVTATIGDSLDMEINSITVDAVPQTPSTLAPLGSRQIRAPYCASGATVAGDSDIGRVIMTSGNDSLMNVGNGCGTTQGWATGTYTNNTSIPGINMVAGSTVNFNICYASSGPAYNSGLGIFIDFNQNGVWDTGEMVYTAPTQLSTTFSGSFTIPCNALVGPTRMRIVSIEFTNITLTEACGTFSYGETEDYTINILNEPAVFQSTTAIQLTGSASAGSTNVPVLRVPVKAFATACLPGEVNELRFNTAGTTNVADIATAKLYKTGNSPVFSVANLVGTVSSPNGAFSFILNDTAVNDTNNYWLAYDVAGTATNNNVLDARFDSADVFGTWYLPVVAAPAGNILVSTPMTYLSSTSVHPTLQKISTATTNNQLLRIQVITSSIGAPIPVTQFDLSTNGSVNTSTNIDSIIVWYTGANPNFVSPVFFGSTGTQTGTYAITGTRNLLNDTNYFWVTYNVPSTATPGDSLDAEVLSITVGGTPQTPSTTAPSGARQIKQQVCIPTYANACTSDDLINNVSTSGGLTNISNLNSGCNGNPNNYIYYPNQTVTVLRGASFTINYQSGTAWDQGFKIFIDYNDDGDFTDAGELVANAASSTNLNTSTIVVPLNAVIGTLRMRVRCAYGAEPATACSGESYGETEDYNIAVLPAPIPTTYVWNQTSPGVFTTATNWTPNRTATNLNDRLQFASGGAVVVSDVPNQTVATINVLNNTVVTLNTSATSNIGANDSLNLTSGRIVTGAGVTLRVGSTTSIGTITGTGSVQGTLMRWVDTLAGTYTFPLSQGNLRRTATLSTSPSGVPTARGTVTAVFTAGLPGNSGLPFTDGFINVNRVAENGFWSFTPGNGFAVSPASYYDLTLQPDSFAGVVNLSSLTIARRTNGASPWDTAGTYVAATGTNSSPIAARANLKVFGDFTLAGDSLTNPLPVELINFKANGVNNDALLTWTTANEANNKGFTVERSVDGANFSDVAFVNGKGNTSTTVNYQLTDVNAFDKATTLYYRLRQVDFDGTETYSEIVTVTKSDRMLTSAQVSPNPFKGSTQLNFVSAEEGAYTISINDIQGKHISTRTVNASKGMNTVVIDELESMGAGVYFINLSGVDTRTIKVIKAGN